MENKTKTIKQSKEWSLSIERYNNEKKDYDINLEQVINKIKHECHYYFAINHNKDKKENGEIRKDHFHIVIKLKTKRTKNGVLKRIAKLLDIKIERISTQLTQSLDLMIRYLMHLDNKKKEQYPPFTVLTNRQDILNNAIKGESEREDLTAENLILTVEKLGGNKLQIMAEIGLKNYTRFRGAIYDIIEELEIKNASEKALIIARKNIQNSNDIALKIYQRANKQIDKKINENIKKIKEKEINTKAVELLNKKKNRL